ncbi:MAG: hypothetical protein J1G02_06335 [Clostridiales bacterium]|nr:hypothetical protein [Clostridiales bacterium]
MKRLADSRLSHDSHVCMDAQTAVKQFVKDSYMRGVTATVKKLAHERALDENDARTVGAKNSLRATAEIQVRQAGHEREIAEHKANGVKFVFYNYFVNQGNGITTVAFFDAVSGHKRAQR